MARVLPKRDGFTEAQRTYIFDAAGGICHICKRPIDYQKEQWHAEHLIPRALGGSDKPPNVKPAHIACHAVKSSEDAKRIAKTKRQRAAHIGAKAAPAQPIRSAPFRQSSQKASREEKREKVGRKRELPPRQLYRKA